MVDYSRSIDPPLTRTEPNSITNPIDPIVQPDTTQIGSIIHRRQRSESRSTELPSPVTYFLSSYPILLDRVESSQSRFKLHSGYPSTSLGISSSS